LVEPRFVPPRWARCGCCCRGHSCCCCCCCLYCPPHSAPTQPSLLKSSLHFPLPSHCKPEPSLPNCLLARGPPLLFQSKKMPLGPPCSPTNCDDSCSALEFCSGSAGAAAAAAAAGWGALLLRDNADSLAHWHTPSPTSHAAAPSSSPSAAVVLDIISCIIPHSPSDAALFTSHLPTLLPLITSSPSLVHLAWLRLLISICAPSSAVHCSSAARGGALLLPVQLAQSGTVEEILPALAALHALAAGVLAPAVLAPTGVAAAAADAHDEECLLCSSGTLQAVFYIMRSSDEPSYITLAASVGLLQCRFVPHIAHRPFPHTTPRHHTASTSHAPHTSQGTGSNNIARLCSLGATSGALKALRMHSSASNCGAVSASAHLLHCIAGF
jgi:hypothetical protein